MLKDFEEELLKSIEFYNNSSIMYDAFKYSLESGGKRIRPMLVLTLTDTLGFDYTKTMDIAIAIEYIHSYSLVHDDLPGMDNDKYRRGKLTTHAKYGEYVGILAGDALLTEAFSIIARSNLKHKSEIIEILAKNAGMRGMIYGQYLDMYNQDKKLDLETLNLIHENKTAALIITCFETVLTELEVKDEKYIKIAKILGKIYQLQDDMFDFNNENDKSNIVNILGVEKSKNILTTLKNELISLLDNGSLKNYIIKILEREK